MAPRLSGWIMLMLAAVLLAAGLPFAFVAGLLSRTANRLATDARACFDQDKPLR